MIFSYEKVWKLNDYCFKTKISASFPTSFTPSGEIEEQKNNANEIKRDLTEVDYLQ